MDDRDMRRRIDAILDGFRSQQKRIIACGTKATKAAGLAVALGASSKVLDACIPVAEYAAPIDASADATVVDNDAGTTSDSGLDDATVVDNDAGTTSDSGLDDATVMYAAPMDAGMDDLGVVAEYAAPMDAGLVDNQNVAMYAIQMDASLDDNQNVALYAVPMDAGLVDNQNVAMYAIQMDDAGLAEDAAKLDAENVDGFVVRYGAPQDDAGD